MKSFRRMAIVGLLAALVASAQAQAAHAETKCETTWAGYFGSGQTGRYELKVQEELSEPAALASFYAALNVPEVVTEGKQTKQFLLSNGQFEIKCTLDESTRKCTFAVETGTYSRYNSGVYASALKLTTVSYARLSAQGTIADEFVDLLPVKPIQVIAGFDPILHYDQVFCSESRTGFIFTRGRIPQEFGIDIFENF